MSEALASWKLTGRVCLWRYSKPPKMYADWHFTADQSACDELAQLTGLLNSNEQLGYRTLPITDPRAVGADRIFGDHQLRVEYPKKLRVSNLPAERTAAELVLNEDVFVMNLGQQWLMEFAAATRDVASGKADFAIRFGEGAQSVRISFWWWPKDAH